MLPEPEYHSLKETYKLLCIMIDPKRSERLPKRYRDMARKCLEDFPVRRTFEELDQGVDFFNPR